MKIHHIISAGLEHGKYYRVYVTQVNKNGIESPRSIPSLIRVGDVEAPPMPVLSVDTSEFSNGCYADGETITVKLRWTESDCDDLDKYVVYRWSSMDGGVGERSKDIADTAEAQYPMTSGTTSTEITGLAAGTNVYFGIQAIDLSRNASNIYVIKVDAEDLTQINQPTSPITVEAYGIWALRVSTPCPQFSNIKYVVFYRDGWKQLSPVIFHKGLDAEIIDALDVLDGLTHFYTYLYITKDGRKSPMSAPSKSATAKPIDTSYIDAAVIEELKKAWQTDDISSTAALLKAASKQAQQVQELYKQLKDVTESYNALYDKYTVAANEIKLLSARVDTAEGTLTAYGTAIEQNATNITLRATKGDIDSATGQLRSGLVSMLNVQADRISSVVADTSKNASAITQLANQMQFKVNAGDLSSQINLAIQDGISVAYIKASRIVLDGQMLLQGNAKLTGRLYASDISLVNNDGSIAWGSNQDVRPATITIGDQGWIPWNNSADWQIKRFASIYFTPRPNIAFNGSCSVHIEAQVYVGVEVPSDSATRPSLNSSCKPWVLMSTSDEADFSNGYRYQEWNTTSHPVTTYNVNSFEYHGYAYNSNVGHMSHTFWQLKTVTYDGILTIGKQLELRFWQRLWGNNEGDNENMGNNAHVFYNINSVRIEVR